MPRNQEVIRQWHILRAIESSRLGLTIAALAADQHVTTRTIRRDLAALQSVGFPIYDQQREDGKYWRLEGAALKGLDRDGFTLAEICALYFSRSLLGHAAGSPFSADLVTAVDRITTVLPPAVRRFLDRLPDVLAIKASPGSRLPDPDHVARLIDASSHHRRARMTYYSASSERTRNYLIEPQRLIYADGALYVVAFVPEYHEARTFALARISDLAVLEETFEPANGVPEGAFADSLGVHQGRPVNVEIEFARRLSSYVRERSWHASQSVVVLPDGRVRLSMHVSNDWALRSWILGFGALARVVAPSSLADEIRTELARAGQQYENGSPRITRNRRPGQSAKAEEHRS